MSDFRPCPTCKQYAWISSHVCAPVWEVSFDNYSYGKWRTVHAMDAEQAAEVAADQFDPDFEYGIIRAGEAVARVRRPGCEEIETFDIEAESRPHYQASRRP